LLSEVAYGPSRVKKTRVKVDTDKKKTAKKGGAAGAMRRQCGKTKSRFRREQKMKQKKKKPKKTGRKKKKLPPWVQECICGKRGRSPPKTEERRGRV